MSSSNLNRENVAYLQAAAQAFMRVKNPFDGDPLLKFLKSKFKLKSPKTDEQRQSTTYVNKTNGTVGEVNSAGIPDGVQFDENLVENQIVWKEYAGELPLIRRNIGKMTEVLNVISAQPKDIEKAVVFMEQEGWGQMMESKVNNKLLTLFRQHAADFLDGNPTIYGTDNVYAASGTLYNFNNLLTGASASISDSGMELLEGVYNNMEDEDGNKVSATVPNVFLTAPSRLSALKTQLMKSSRVNENYRGPIDSMNSDIKIVGSLPTSLDVIYSFSDINGLEIPVESMEPQVEIGFDKRGNMLMTVYFFWGFGFNSRLGTAKQLLS